MSKYYWFFEAVKVVIAYGFLVFVWPCLVFRKWLKGRSKTVLFSFCVLITGTLLPFCVLILGLIHLLNIWIVRILFWVSLGLTLYPLLPRISWWEDIIRRIANHNLSFRQIAVILGGKACFLLKNFLIWFKREILPHIVEYLVLTCVIIYGILWTAKGVFDDKLYGFGDMYVHHQWIYGLVQGKAFSGGIYPEGMHAVIYLIHILFGIEIYSINLFFFIPRNIVLFLAGYLLVKQLFHWRYAGIAAMCAFVVLRVDYYLYVIRLPRLAWALPQEYGMIASLLSALFLYCYLKEEKKPGSKNDSSKTGWISGILREIVTDENLLLFLLSVLMTLIMHYYATIFAFILCIGVVIPQIHRVFTLKYFRSLFTSVIFAFMIGFMPFAIGLMEGIELEHSLYWALSVMEDTEEQNQGTSESEMAEKTVTSEKTSGSESVLDVYLFRRNPFYSPIYMKLVLTGWFLSIVVPLVWLLFSKTFNRIKKREILYSDKFLGYFTLAIILLVEITFANAEGLGLPVIMSGSRMTLLTHLLMCAQMVVPLDLLFLIFSNILAKWLRHILSVSFMLSIYAVAICTGNLHGPLCAEIVQYSATVNTIERIKEQFPEKTYTTVATTSELYQVIEHGFHEELSNFIGYQENLIKADTDFYCLPTKYIFLMIEKRPIIVGFEEVKYYTGPNWLIYNDPEKNYNTSIMAGKISEDAACEDISNINLNEWNETYKNERIRNILESKMYYWAQKFKKMYPNEMKTYYEDEDIVCYCITQNPQNPYNLKLKN